MVEREAELQPRWRHLARSRSHRRRRGQALWRCPGRRATARAANTRGPPAQDPRAKEALEREAGADGRSEALPEPKAQRQLHRSGVQDMRSRTEGFVQAYNAGAVVDEKAQVIVATTLSAIRPTPAPCRPWWNAVEANTGRHPSESSPTRLLLRGEHHHLKSAGIDATSPQAARATTLKLVITPGPHPVWVTPTQRMARKLSTKAGRAHYARRKPSSNQYSARSRKRAVSGALACVDSARSPANAACLRRPQHRKVVPERQGEPGAAAGASAVRTSSWAWDNEGEIYPTSPADNLGPTTRKPSVN